VLNLLTIIAHPPTIIAHPPTIARPSIPNPQLRTIGVPLIAGDNFFLYIYFLFLFLLFSFYYIFLLFSFLLYIFL
jgi:hypothetical protein